MTQPPSDLTSLEGRHRPQGPGWNEIHRLHATGGSTTVFAQIRIGADGAGVRVLVAGAGHDPITVVDHEVSAPAVGWEFRAPGLWIEAVCETPMEHWSYGLEAFGLELDDPQALLGRAYGLRVPIGWELDFVATDPAGSAAQVWSDDQGRVRGYRQNGSVDGIILTDSGQAETGQLSAVRHHWWGADGSGLEAERPGVSEAEAPSSAAVALPGPGGTIWVDPKRSVAGKPRI